MPPDQTKIERQGPPPADATAFKAISWNVDGIRAAGRKERVLKLLEDESPDLLCIQETKVGNLSNLSNQPYPAMCTALHRIVCVCTQFSYARCTANTTVQMEELADEM